MNNRLNKLYRNKHEAMQAGLCPCMPAICESGILSSEDFSQKGTVIKT